MNSSYYSEFIYFPESDEWGVCLGNLYGDGLYDIGDDDNFDSNSYFIFDLDSPGKGRITDIYSDIMLEEVYIIDSALLSSVEDIRLQAIDAAKSANLKSFDSDNPIYGVWLVQTYSQSYNAQISGYDVDTGFAVFYSDKTVEYIFNDYSYKLQYSYNQERIRMMMINDEDLMDSGVSWWEDGNKFLHFNSLYIRILFE